MGKAENSATKEIWAALTHAGSKLWRNNCGTAYFGNVPVKYGIGNPGGSDLIGYTRITITPAMVGATLPVFTAIEAKAPKKKAEEHQLVFLKKIADDSGIAAVCHSYEEAAKAITEYKDRW